ncbi:L,D-transpeptidase [uncultured Corynebacterium sp.]|uniref:L,D-transpeptidase n=1 Tax=uncultured Corynebacterium sp. TaxID=159447 RepID=UPI0026100EA1|nr:L,D-transpeptidase [uncultured Corynebacterium sp.]
MIGKHRLKSTATRRSTAALAAAATAGALLAQPAAASAQDLGSSNITAGLDQLNNDIRNNAWQTRNNLVNQADAVLPAPHNQNVKNMVDGGMNLLFPGLVDQKLAEKRAAEEAAARAEAERLAAEQARIEAEQAEAARRDALNIPQGVCPPEAKACIDIEGNRAWLQENGKITYGPVPASAGADGHDTPQGMMTVNRKIKDEVSREFGNAPMPYAVYFTYNGIAFHAGSPYILSHGCIHLNYGDAKVFFEQLNIGDRVFAYGDKTYGYPNGPI